jgi:hypothetical protein
MTWSNTERLYQNLPAIYRLRDSAEGEPLRALLAVIEQELELVEADIEGLYENWFVETADEWVLPYIGDLLGVTPLHTVESAGVFSNRAYVANTLRYRRRKGTAAVLEQLARDVTNWRARVVEFFQLLSTTQHVNHIRLENYRTPHLRAPYRNASAKDGANRLELLETPFTNAARTAEVRRIAPAEGDSRGKWNIPNLGIFLWRLQSYPLKRVSARPVSDLADSRFWFHPVGIDAPLFNRPQTETTISHLAEEHNVPGALRRRALYDDLLAYRQALTSVEGTPASIYFGVQPVFQIHLNGQETPLLPEEINICDLSDWDTVGWTPPDSQAFVRADGTPISTQVGVDPALGRLAVLDGVSGVSSLEASYYYGFSGDLGGGPYNRTESLEDFNFDDITWQIGVSQKETAVPGEIANSLTEAINLWNAQPAGTVGVIAVMDSRTYDENLQGAQSIQMPERSKLLIVAADWPEQPVPGLLGVTERAVGQITPNNLRPHLLGNISVRGTASAAESSQGALWVNGLLIEGEFTVLIGNLGTLNLSDCTLVPAAGDLQVNHSASNTTENDQLSVEIRRCILGRVDLAESVPQLRCQESIIQPTSGAAIEAPGSHAVLNTSTITGTVDIRILEASETIFIAPVIAEQRQIGCVRFSHVPIGSRTPRRYRCQPDLALKNISDPNEAHRIRAYLKPIFTSDEYGNPAYMQLDLAVAEKIFTGAEDGAEMGAFNHLKQALREANLRQVLKEYLRFGLEAGIFYVP